MKHFLVGALLGVTSGLILASLKDENGQRLGKPLKDNFEALRHESQRFSQALKKAKKASQTLKKDLPQARRALSDISDDVTKYQRHIQPRVDQLREKSVDLSDDAIDLKPEK